MEVGSNAGLSSSAPPERRRRKAMPSYQRRQGARRGGLRRMSLTTADQIELENDIRDTMLVKIYNMLPLFAWMIWLIVGTLYYKYHDLYDWSLALYISVSVGWAMGWNPPYIAELHNNGMSKLYSAVHVSIGEIFVGVAVIYLAQELVHDTESWMISMLKTIEHTEETCFSKAIAVFRKFRVLLILLIWILFGVIFSTLAIPEWGVMESCDHVISTLTGSGYKAIPDDSPKWMFVVSALYTFSGYPLTVIALGLIVSSLLAGSHERHIYEKICEDISPEEVEVMHTCGIGRKEHEDLSKGDFIVLMLVRIGAAPTPLVQKLHERFRTLDRKGEGHIAYDDIIYGRKKKPTKTELISKLFMRSFSTSSMFASDMRKSLVARGSFTSSKSSPTKVHPGTHTEEFMDMRALEEGEGGNEDSFTPGTVGAMTPDTDRRNGYMSLSLKVKSERRSKSNDSIAEEEKEAVVSGKADLGERYRSESAPPVLGSLDPTLSSSGSDADGRCSRRARAERGDITEVEVIREDDMVSPCDTESVVALVPDEQHSPCDTDSEVHSEVGYDAAGMVGIADLAPTASMSQICMCSRSESETPSKIDTMRGDVESYREGNGGGEDNEDDDDDEEEEEEEGDQVMPLGGAPTAPAPRIASARAPRVSKVVAYQLSIQKKRDLLSTIQLGNKQLLQTIKEYTILLLKDSHFILFLIWFTWLYGGALFFALAGDISISRGLYISVSVGYGIFWAEPHYTPIVKAYTILHLLFGSCMVACAMAAFARSIVESQKKWYIDAMRRQAMADAAATEEIWDDIVAYTNYWFPKLKVPFLFVTWAALGVSWSCYYVGWTFIDGLYFVTSGLATGGMWPIPDDSPQWFFFFVGVYVSCGVPIMALAIGTLADLVANSRSEMQLEEKMNSRVTDEELQLMTDCGIENGDGFIDVAEFVILILLRLRAVSPDLIGVIEDRFTVLDVDKDGVLTYKELTVRTVEVVRRIRSHQSLRGFITSLDN